MISYPTANKVRTDGQTYKHTDIPDNFLPFDIMISSTKLIHESAIQLLFLDLIDLLVSSANA